MEATSSKKKHSQEIKTYEFHVEMKCGGCANTLKRILSRKQDHGYLKDFQIFLNTQKIVLVSPLELPEVEAILESCGKKFRHVKTTFSGIEEVNNKPKTSAKKHA